MTRSAFCALELHGMCLVWLWGWHYDNVTPTIRDIPDRVSWWIWKHKALVGGYPQVIIDHGKIAKEGFACSVVCPQDNLGDPLHWYGRTSLADLWTNNRTEWKLTEWHSSGQMVWPWLGRYNLKWNKPWQLFWSCRWAKVSYISNRSSPESLRQVAPRSGGVWRPLRCYRGFWELGLTKRFL